MKARETLKCFWDWNACAAGVGVAGLMTVLTQWPTFNHHTDYTSVMSAADGTWDSNVWTDGAGGGGGGGGGGR